MITLSKEQLVKLVSDGVAKFSQPECPQCNQGLEKSSPEDTEIELWIEERALEDRQDGHQPLTLKEEAFLQLAVESDILHWLDLTNDPQSAHVQRVFVVYQKIGGLFSMETILEIHEELRAKRCRQ